MVFFETYRDKFEKAQAEIMQLKNQDAEIKIKLAQTALAVQRVEQERDRLQSACNKLKDLLGSDGDELQSARQLISSIKKECEKLQQQKENQTKEINDLTAQIAQLRNQYIELDEAVLLQSFALYQPQYNYSTSVEYKAQIEKIKKKQAELIIQDKAALCTRIWALEGSTEKGKKFEYDNIKQILRSFNVECDDIIQKVKFSNYDASKKRIQRTFDLLNKLNAINKIRITHEFLNLKFEELTLAFEYIRKKQEEREELRRQRELHREELRLAKEIEEKRAEIEKEQLHYKNVIRRLEEQIAIETNMERLKVLKQRMNEINVNLLDLDKAMKDINYREANQRAGYVYIISNIGAFGENIYKIGMTRRLEPLDRIDELSGASVPFRFDVHALIFSNDAPALESALHRAFDSNKVNMVNGRKEFFNVTLEEIEAVVKANHDEIIEFTYLPDAEQYRETLLIKSGRRRE